MVHISTKKQKTKKHTSIFFFFSIDGLARQKHYISYMAVYTLWANVKYYKPFHIKLLSLK